MSDPQFLIDASSAVSALESAHATHEKVISRIQGDSRLSDQAKRADRSAAEGQFEAINADLKAKVVEVIARGTAQLDDEQFQIEDAVKLRPRKLEHWQEAAAKSSFIAEDVKGLIEAGQSGQIAQVFRRAMKSGDIATAFLVARHGKAQLAALTQPGNLNVSGNEREAKALQELVAAVAEVEHVDPDKLGALKEKRAKLFEVRNKLNGLQSAREIEQLKARFGLK